MLLQLLLHLMSLPNLDVEKTKLEVYNLNSDHKIEINSGVKIANNKTH